MEERVFLKEYTYTVNCRDCYDRLSPVSILNFFQDVATKHVEKYNLGFYDLIKQGFLWVLVRTKYKVFKYPSPDEEKIIIKTWQSNMSRVDFTRDYIIYSSSGEKLIIGSSKWCLIDIDKRRLLPTKVLGIDITYSELSNFETSFNKLDFPSLENLDTLETEKVTFSKIDRNKHLNNTYYAEYIMNSLKLSSQEVIEDFEINYIKETLLDEMIEIKSVKEDNIIFVEGYRKNNNDLLFRSKIVLK